MIICSWILTRMRKVSNKAVDNIKIHIICSMTFSENRVDYEIMSTNVVEPERPQMTI